MEFLAHLTIYQADIQAWKDEAFSLVKKDSRYTHLLELLSSVYHHDFGDVDPAGHDNLTQ
jgi:hypothetical protein